MISQDSKAKSIQIILPKFTLEKVDRQYLYLPYLWIPIAWPNIYESIIKIWYCRSNRCFPQQLNLKSSNPTNRYKWKRQDPQKQTNQLRMLPKLPWSEQGLVTVLFHELWQVGEVDQHDHQASTLNHQHQPSHMLWWWTRSEKVIRK